MTTSGLDVTILERRFPQLARRRRGVVRAPQECHLDNRPSFSVDLDRGLWYCFACARGGGLRAFAALVGELRVGPLPKRTTSERAEIEDRWHGVAMWPLTDVVRVRSQTAYSLRLHATRLGPDAPATWPLLAHGALLEREGFVAEAALDGILAEGRLP